MTEHTPETEDSFQLLAIKFYAVVFIVLDIATSWVGIYRGMPANNVIKVIGAIAFTALITAGILCTRIIFELEKSNLKLLLYVLLSICISLDAWTSFEGLHKFISPEENDVFGWFLLVVATLGCVAAPIVATYLKEVKIKIES